jgi:SNF2 family DNA or RNA helicase
VLCNYKTGGTGLNLTDATVTHIIDEEWNAGKRDQSYKRTHRLGQTERTEVLVYRIPASIDTWMANIINRKERMVAQFTETMVDEPEAVITPKELLDSINRGEML